ncbi:MAG: hypothetical protein GU355_06150 [Caldivirga sp.]|nr:hypothetical protein [Caldivirga sp.]
MSPELLISSLYMWSLTWTLPFTLFTCNDVFFANLLLLSYYLLTVPR